MIQEYIVTKDILNIRSRPTEESIFEGQLLKDDTVWLDDKEVKGVQPRDGESDIWLPYSPNYYVSKDGLRLKNYEDKKNEFIHSSFNKLFLDKEHPNDADKWKVSWGHVDLEIWKIWRDYKTMGEGVKVGIIDTGVHDSINDLQGQVKKKISFAPNDSRIEDSLPFHGTKSAGVIGANGEFTNTVYGIAPKADIYIYKATNALFDFTEVIQCIKECINDGVKIISMSFSCQDDASLQSWIDYAAKKDIILISSAGDTNSNFKMYPASYEGCLCVGAYYILNDNRIIYRERSNHNDSVAFLAPGKDVLTTSIDDSKAFHQETSAAAAFAAGILALIVSKYPNLNYSRITELLKTSFITTKIESGDSRSDYEGYGVLEPIKIINSLK